MRVTDTGWHELVHDLAARVAVYAPDWTESSDSDPGITIVELFAFLGESLLDRADQIPERRVRLLAELARLERLAASNCRRRDARSSPVLRRTGAHGHRPRAGAGLPPYQAPPPQPAAARHRRRVGLRRLARRSRQGRQAGDLRLARRRHRRETRGARPVRTDDQPDPAEADSVLRQRPPRRTGHRPGAGGRGHACRRVGGGRVQEATASGHLPIARLFREGGASRVDASFQRPRGPR